MKTPREKYQNDPEYNRLVKMLEGFIHHARFTPSELREACILACINYEMSHVRDYHDMDPRLEKAFNVFGEFFDKPSNRRR